MEAGREGAGIAYGKATIEIDGYLAQGEAVTRRSRWKTLLQQIDESLRAGNDIEIDGIGNFELAGGEIVFQPSARARVFLAYASEDRAEVRKLSQALKKAGFEPWMDVEKLLPGQNWPRAIERAIEIADFIVVCFSSRAVAKRGFFQAELRYALDVAACVPLDEIFLVPVRLSECELPIQISRRTQYIDLFPSWEEGVRALAIALKSEATKRSLKR